MSTPEKSPALTHQSKYYPERFEGKVPYKVRMLKTVSSVLPDIIKPILWAYRDEVYEAWVNQNGAVSAFTAEGLLGIKPNEFEIIEWHKQTQKGGE